MSSNGEQAIQPAGDGRLYGWIIIVGSLLVLAGMFRHPTFGGASVLETVRIIAREGAFNALVHGFLMAVMLVLVVGFLGFSQRLSDRPLAQAGLVAYIAGTFAGISAAIAAGFAIRSVALGYLNATPDQADTISGALRVLGSLNFAWGRMWILAVSAGILLWGIALLRTGGAARLAGAIGLVAGGAPAIGMVTGLLPLSVIGSIVAIAAHTLWGVVVGVLMVRGKL